MTTAVYLLATQENVEKYPGVIVYPLEGNDYLFKAVDEPEVDDWLRKGWSLTFTEAVNDEKTTDQEVREQLIKRLTEAGIKFHPNSKTDTLQAKVDELDKKTAS
jgi:hypothetical protein